MPFNRPTLGTLISRTLSNIRLYSGIDAFLRFSIVNAIGRAVAAMSHSLYGRILYLTEQLPHKAENEYLDGWCGTYGVTRRAASKATGIIVITSYDTFLTSSSSIVFSRSDGVLYVPYGYSTFIAVASGQVRLNVICESFGEIGNCDAGTVLTLSQSQPDFINAIDNEVVVDVGGITGGTDIEDDETRRGRLLDRINYPPHGGNLRDYILWAREISGVTRVWPYSYPDKGVAKGHVAVVVAMDNTSPNGIPNSSNLATIQNYIEENYRPVCAQVTVYAPIPVAVNLVIELYPDEESIRSEIELLLTDLFLTIDPGGTVYLSQLYEAIASAVGEEHHTLNAPVANVELQGFEIPILGTITWA